MANNGVDINEFINAIENRKFENQFNLSESFDDFLIRMDKEFADNISKITEDVKFLTSQKMQAEALGNTELAKVIQRKIDALNNENDNLQKKRKKPLTEKEYEKVIKDKAYKVLGGENTANISRTAASIRKAGEAFAKIGFEKFGGSISKLSSSILKNAGPIGTALKGFQIAAKLTSVAMDKYAEYMQYKTEQQQFENEKENIIHERQLSLTQTTGEQFKAEQTNVITKAKNEISTFADIIKQGNSIIYDAYSSSAEITLKSFKDIAGGAFAAANKYIDIQAASDKFKVHKELQERTLSARNEFADVQLGIAKSNISAENQIIRTNASTQLDMNAQKQAQSRENFTRDQIIFGTQAILSVADKSGITSQIFGEVANSYSNLIKAEQGYDNALLEGTNNEKNYRANLNKARTEIQNTLKSVAAEFKNFSIESLNSLIEEIYNQVRDANMKEAKAWLNFSQDVFNSFQKAETAAFQMGRAFNFNESQLNAYAKRLSNTQIVVSTWGKTMADIAKMQMSYQESTGRNIMLSDTDLNKSFANGYLVGDDTIAQLNSGMEIFNHSVSDSNDMFYEMYQHVTKMGLNGKKYAKDLVNNLKLAEKYNFKGGVKNLMEMSKWAQNVRFNTGSLDTMLNKTQTGGLEGVIKQAAELQVLGGNFAMGSDPLAMAYESFMDPDAYAKRMNAMIAGQGQMNKNGEVSFGIASQQIMRQFAESTGQDFKDVLNQARQQVKANKISSIVGSRFDEDQLAAVTNNARYNKKSGNWEVNGKDVRELTTSDVESLSGSEENGTVEENVAKMRSTAEKMEATQKKISATMQSSLWEECKESAEQMINNINTEFTKNLPEYRKNVGDVISNIPRYQKKIIDFFNGKDEDSELKGIKNAVESLTSTFSGVLNSTNEALNNLASGINKAFPDAHADAGSLDIKALRAHFGDEKWLRKSFNEGTEEFKIMQRLYNDFGNTMSAMMKNGKISYNDMIALEVLSRWDPDSDVADAKLSQSQRAVILNFKPGKWGKSIIENMHADAFDEGYTPYGAGNGSALPTKVMSQTVGNHGDVQISKNGYPKSISDGLVVQNGVPTRIDNNDQVLAAKSDGPIDKMLDMIQPRPMQYDSYVKETPYIQNQHNENVFNRNNGKLEIAPVSININGNIQVNGTNIDLTNQIQNDPNFQNALWSLISVEVAKRIDNSGRTIDPLYNRIKNV